MKAIKVNEICQIIDGVLITGTGEEKISDVYQDSRLIEHGSGFFAVKGANFDGHDYLASTVEKGAALLVIENKEKFEQFCNSGKNFEGSCILVKNTVQALVKLAKKYLESLQIKKIGVTGSCGKTSTRDMIYYVCNEKYKTHRNKGNFNTLVGVALTILDMPEDTDVAIFEMGMDGPGQIREIAEVVRPDMAVITNVGVSHLENFENRDGIFHAKMEITEFFKGTENLIVYGDNIYLNHKRLSEKVKDSCKVLVSGIDDEIENTDIKISNIVENTDLTVSFDIKMQKEFEHINLPVPGKHNAGNASLALAVGKELGISLKEGVIGLSKMNLTGKRLLVEEGNGLTVINDTYNANPLSMKAAIDILVSGKCVENGRKIAVLGDMYELGPDEVEYHREVGEYAIEKVDLVYSVGDLAKAMGADLHFNNKEEILADKDKLFKSGDMILVKASNGMHLDKLVEGLLSSK